MQLANLLLTGMLLVVLLLFCLRQVINMAVVAVVVIFEFELVPSIIKLGVHCQE